MYFKKNKLDKINRHFIFITIYFFFSFFTHNFSLRFVLFIFIFCFLRNVFFFFFLLLSPSPSSFFDYPFSMFFLTLFHSPSLIVIHFLSLSLLFSLFLLFFPFLSHPISAVPVPVPVKSTRRRTLDGKSPTAAAAAALLSSSSSSGLNPASTPVHVITSISSPDTPTDTYSVNSCSTNNSYTTASLPDGPGKNSESLVKCTESEKEKVKEKEEKDSKECERTLPSPTLIPINEGISFFYYCFISSSCL